MAAAKEIGVTPAAISQHIRKLEDFLGKQLFLRLNNRILLTDAGQVVFDAATTGLQIISDATEQQLRKSWRSRLTISCIESVAEKWLTPRLVRYKQLHSDLSFDLRIESDPVDFATHNIDLRLTYDPSHYHDHLTTTLGHDAVLPMCSPGYLDRHPLVRDLGMAGVPPEDLLHVSWGPSFGSRPGWSDWFDHSGMVAAEMSLGSQVGNLSIALDLARAGLGVVLGQRIVAETDLAAGQLVALADVGIQLGHAYGLVYPRAKRDKRHLVGLIEWLTMQSAILPSEPAPDPTPACSA